MIEKQDQLVIQTPKEIKTKISNQKGKFKPGSEARQYVVGSPRGGQGRGGEVETNIHLCQNHCHYNFVLTSLLSILSSLLSSLSLAGSPSWWLAHLFSSRFSSSTQSPLETMRRAQQPKKCRLPTNLLGEGSKVCIWPLSPLSLIICVISVDSTHHMHPKEFWESHRRVLQRLSCGCWSWWWWTRWTPCRVTSCLCQTGKNQSLLYGDIQRKYSLSSKLLFSLHTTIAMSVIIRLVQKGMEIALPRWKNMQRKKHWTQTMITAITF